MTAPLSVFQLEQIATRHERTQAMLRSGRGNEGAVALGVMDIGPLLREIDRLRSAQAQAWEALDLISRDAVATANMLHKMGLLTHANDVGSLGGVASKVLRLQYAPGHKATSAHKEAM